MNAIRQPSRLRRIVLAALIVMVGCVLVVGAFMVSRARQEARRSTAYGRLYQMRAVLQLYEQQHGRLPPLCLRDNQGKPIHSWRALILPHVQIESLNGLDLSEPWDSAHNRRIIENTPPGEWTYFARDVPSDQSPASTHILALLGADSIWEATTGLPKGTTGEHPNAILLISVPESNIEPMQPGDITEDAVRELVEDGQEVLFITAGTGHGYGVVKIEGGRLVFDSWQEVLDREGSTP